MRRGGYPPAMDTILARKMWATLEPYTAMIYFAPEAFAAWEQLGLAGKGMGHFASRSAPMGRVGAGVVAASFYNFNPALVARHIPAAWDIASPEEILAARLEAVDAALRRLIGDAIESDEMTQAADVALAAATAGPIDGRPLFAGYRDLDIPDEPHLRLWHAITLLREFRGDGHVAALAAAGLSGLEAVVSYAATGEMFNPDFYRRSRGWSEQEWAGGHARLAEQGWIDDDGDLTEAGRQGRARIEADTDRLAMPPWEAIGQTAADELRAAIRPWSRAIVSAGGIGSSPAITTG